MGKHRVPYLQLPSTLDAQFGTPYPRSAGFDTDSGRPRKYDATSAVAPQGREHTS